MILNDQCAFSFQKTCKLGFMELCRTSPSGQFLNWVVITLTCGLFFMLVIHSSSMEYLFFIVFIAQNYQVFTKNLLFALWFVQGWKSMFGLVCPLYLDVVSYFKYSHYRVECWELVSHPLPANVYGVHYVREEFGAFGVIIKNLKITNLCSCAAEGKRQLLFVWFLVNIFSEDLWLRSFNILVL